MATPLNEHPAISEGESDALVKFRISAEGCRIADIMMKISTLARTNNPEELTESSSAYRLGYLEGYQAMAQAFNSIGDREDFKTLPNPWGEDAY